MKSSLTGVVKRIDVKPNKTEGIENYDTDNAYPQRVVDIINSSGTATLCVNMMAKFIFGNGFKDTNLANFVVNKKGETADDLLRKISRSIAFFNGLPIHVGYNGLCEKVSLTYTDFQTVRFTSEENKEHKNMFALHEDWQKTKGNFKKEKITYLHYYNPAKVQEEVEATKGETIVDKWRNYKGQLFYWSIDGMQYPLCPCDSVIEDVQTDSKTKNFKYRNITTNFMASHLLQVQKFEDGESKQAFIDNLTSFQGDDDALQIFMVEVEGEESNLKLDKIEIQDVDKLYEYTEESVRNNIIRNFLIPPALLLDTSDGFSDGKIKDATALYNGQTQDFRLLCSTIMEKLLTNFKGANFTDFTIEPRKADSVEIKDTIEGKAKILEVLKDTSLTSTQKRNMLVDVFEIDQEMATKLIPIEQEVETVDFESKAKADLRGSVGGVSGILALQTSVAQGITSRSSALGVLEVIFGLSNQDAVRILGDVEVNPNVKL